MPAIRTVFMGSPEFAVPSLDALHRDERIEVTLAVTQPDRRAGRGRKLQSPAVKVASEDRGIPLIQPGSLREPGIFERLANESPDLIVVVSYGELLRKSLLDLPKHGCLNVHPSLLPRYRGASPIPAAILAGDAETGVSIMRLTRRMDAGPILAQRRSPLDGTETTGALTRRLAEESGLLLPGTITGWVFGEIDELPQHEDDATYTRELRKADGQVDWREPAVQIERFVRAMNPWPMAWTTLAGERLTIHSVRVGSDAHRSERPGAIELEQEMVRVQTGDGIIDLERIQPAGKKPLSALDWARGARLESAPAFDLPEEQRPPLIFTR